MAFKVAAVLCVLVVVAAAVPPGGVGGWGPPAWGPPAWGPSAWGPPGAGAAPGGGAAWVPPWIAAAPWFPKWTPCTTVGATCLDCNTKTICTPVGGIQKACTDPTLPYCNLGECSATPTAECAPATEATVQPTPV